MDRIEVGDVLVIAKGSSKIGLRKGENCEVISITAMGADYSRAVKVIVRNGARTYVLWARHENRLSDHAIRLGNGTGVQHITLERTFKARAPMLAQDVVDNWLSKLDHSVIAGEIYVQPRDERRCSTKPGKGIWLRDGRDIPCAVCFRDVGGTWIGLTETGEEVAFSADLVA